MRVQWVPHKDDLFFSWGNDLSLYQVDLNVARSNQNFNDGRRRENLLASYTDLKFIRCLAVSPFSTSTLLLAIGQTSGGALLASIQPDDWELNRINQLASRHERPCNSLSWERNGTQLLAVGLDKHRSDFSISIWDASLVSQQVSAARLMQLPPKPLFEIGHSESTMSLSWLKQPRMLAAGMNNRALRIFDLRARDPVKSQMSTATRLVYGVSVDPFMEHRLATFADNQVALWDQRNFERPVSTLTDSRTKGIVCIGWSPTRRDRLSSVGKESGLLKLHDIKHYGVYNSEIEPTVGERYAEGLGDVRLADFSWHPTIENRVLLSTLTGSRVYFSIVERITMNWSPGFTFVWSDGSRRFNTEHSDTFRDQLSDVSAVMRDRALKGYGVAERIIDNALLVDSDALNGVWTWLSYSVELLKTNDGKDSRQVPPYQGVRSVLSSGSAAATPSVIELRGWTGVDRVAKCKIYRSEGRDRALRLCGWGVDDAGQTALLESLEREGCHARAAAISVFQLTLRRAIQVLQRSKQPQLQVVSVALSGFTSEKRALWQQTSLELQSSFTDPYIRMVFAFMTSADENFHSVLSVTGVTVQDRVAFACRFLSDDRLTVYLDQLTVELKADASLHAILLTGVSDEGLELLQLYVNRYGDVQTAALISAHAKQSQDPRAQIWINCYRELLDLWRLWKQRALFDVNVLYQGCGSARDMNEFSQSTVACNYCNKSVSAIMDDVTRKRQLARTGGNTKVICCPHCRKSLPRCALCLTQLGTSAARWGPLTAGSAAISTWFTWCQTCRHGGHAAHMAGWFDENAECPVTGCVCRCMSLDAVGRISFNDTHA